MRFVTKTLIISGTNPKAQRWAVCLKCLPTKNCAAVRTSQIQPKMFQVSTRARHSAGVWQISACPSNIAVIWLLQGKRKELAPQVLLEQSLMSAVHAHPILSGSPRCGAKKVHSSSVLRCGLQQVQTCELGEDGHRLDKCSLDNRQELRSRTRLTYGVRITWRGLWSSLEGEDCRKCSAATRKSAS